MWSRHLLPPPHGSPFFFFFFLMIRRPPRSTLFPYTTALPIYHEEPDRDPDGRGHHGDRRGHPGREPWDAPVAPALPGRGLRDPGRPAVIPAQGRLPAQPRTPVWPRRLGAYPPAVTRFHLHAPSRAFPGLPEPSGAFP